MMKHRNAVLVVAIVTTITSLGALRALAQNDETPKGAQSRFETMTASVLKVFSAEQEDHRFIAYLVKWKEFEVIVSDPLGKSNFQEGDEIRFMAQKVSLPNADQKVSALNFMILDDPRSARVPKTMRAGDAKLIDDEARQLRLVEGNLGMAKNQTERFYALNRAAKNAMKDGMTDEARELAEELLRLAKDKKNDWNYGNAIQDSNQVLGRIALLKGDVAEAKLRLLASSESKGSPQMNSFGPNMQLAKELLQKGEKEVVLEYFARCRGFWAMGSDKLASWTEQVKNDKTPEFGANLDF